MVRQSLFNVLCYWASVRPGSFFNVQYYLLIWFAMLSHKKTLESVNILVYRYNNVMYCLTIVGLLSLDLYNTQCCLPIIAMLSLDLYILIKQCTVLSSDNRIDVFRPLSTDTWFCTDRAASLGEVHSPRWFRFCPLNLTKQGFVAWRRIWNITNIFV